MDNNEILNKFILKQIAGEVLYSEEKHSFQLSLRTISSTIREKIMIEGRKWGMSVSQIEDCLNSVVNNVALAYRPKEQCTQSIDVSDALKPGIEVILEGAEKGKGKCRLQLLFLGYSETVKQVRFMVLKSSRLCLLPEDIVEPEGNTIWAIGYPVLLKVYRNKKRYPDSMRVYRTLQIENISMVMPSVVHEVIDSRKEFTYLEHIANLSSGISDYSLSLGRNLMSLLLHEYSCSLPIYADFTEEGRGSFLSNPDVVLAPSNMCDILFGIKSKSQQSSPLSIETQEAGELYYDSEKSQIRLVKPAQAKIKKT